MIADRNFLNLIGIMFGGVAATVTIVAIVTVVGHVNGSFGAL